MLAVKYPNSREFAKERYFLRWLLFVLMLPLVFFTQCTEVITAEDSDREITHCENDNPSGTYFINNEYGTGFIRVNTDETYIHHFKTQDSSYSDTSTWLLNYSEKENLCKISFDDWKWHYPVFPHTKPDESIINVMILNNSCLSALVTGKENSRYDFCKQSIQEAK